MERFVHSLQVLPNSKKRLIVWGVPFILTATVFFFWMISIRSLEIPEENVPVADVSSPFDEIKNLGAHISDGFEDQFGRIDKVR